jgi:hypothetical protein
MHTASQTTRFTALTASQTAVAARATMVILDGDSATSFRNTAPKSSIGLWSASRMTGSLS